MRFSILALLGGVILLQQSSTVVANSAQQVVPNQISSSQFATRPYRQVHAQKQKNRNAIIVQQNEPFPESATKQTNLAKHVISDAISRGGGNGSKITVPTDAISGVIVMSILERFINKIFVQQGIKFPAQLAGCIGLFFFMILSDIVRPGLGETIYNLLTPGAALLSKWFPVMFVPGLILLPLAPSIGDGAEIAKFLIVTVIGFFYSITSTAYAVLFLRAAQGKIVASTPTAPPTKPMRRRGNQKNVPPPSPPAVKPYDDATASFLFKAAILSGIVSLCATNLANDFATPLQTLFLFMTTLAAYVWGARLPPGFNKAVHPLITCTIVVLSVIRLAGLATGVDWIDILKSYKVGSYNLSKMGAGDIMMFLLAPSVVSFSVSMFSRRKLLQDNLVPVFSAMLVASAGSLFGTAGFVRLIQLGGSSGLLVRLSVLSRGVTTALAIACTELLGGDNSLAVTIVILTGIFGATYGRRTLDFLGIKDPITRGLAIGGSAQGLGVSSMISETDAFPFAAMSMILAAISSTVLVSIPAVKDMLVAICEG